MGVNRCTQMLTHNTRGQPSATTAGHPDGPRTSRSMRNSQIRFLRFLRGTREIVCTCNHWHVSRLDGLCLPCLAVHCTQARPTRRRGRDSNPRGFWPTRFPIVRTRPDYATSPQVGALYHWPSVPSNHAPAACRPIVRGAMAAQGSTRRWTSTSSIGTRSPPAAKAAYRSPLARL
jgi:hypothetical protein